MAHAIDQLRQAGQSVWLDFIRRGMITSGELDRMVRDRWITGITSNPTIFRKAIAGSDDYDDALREVADRDACSPYEAFIEIGAEDIRMAADILRPVFDDTNGGDGYISFEAQAGTAEQIIDEVQRMYAAVGRPNVLIKVPGTQPGIAAVEELIARGYNINITLLFDVDVYQQVVNAYLTGLERRFDVGDPIDQVASVASFFVSRVDTKVDSRLPDDSPLRGKVAIANARLAYKRFQDAFTGDRWERLAKAGARVQRPLWGSTGTKNPEYSDILYVEELIAPQTVNTMPEPTLRAFLDHGRVRPSIEEGLADADETLRRAADAGIDLKAVTDELLEEGLEAFGKDFDALLEEIAKSLDVAQRGRPRHSANLGDLGSAVEGRLDAIADANVTERLWQHDHTLWKPEQDEITNRLGWLTTVDTMLDCTGELRAFADSVTADGLRTAVLLGMGGSSLAPEVLHATFGSAASALDLRVLDTTDPAAIRSLESTLDLATTLFIVASKSGTTVETMSHLAYFWEKLPDGRHFTAITDPGTPLETLARERDFRKVFLNAPDIGGRYSALSYFGLVPAALIGVDVDALLDRAHEMVHACHECVTPPHNPGVWLGAVIGEAALAGRDKLTLLLPNELTTLGYWIEQLIAESTGKEGKGVVPVEGEPLATPDVYGDDRLFVALGEEHEPSAVEQAGYPVIRLPYTDTLQLGAEFFRWELATAVAGHVLGINPFDQPDVQSAKDTTRRILERGAVEDVQPEPIDALLDQVKPGDYIALQAYLPRTAEIDDMLQRARRRLRDRTHAATTVGYGPRFLHSTGQLHKGGPNTGVFLQVVGDDDDDLEIPGQPYTFGTLKRAQALGDLQSLRERGRRAGRVTLADLREVAS